MHERKWYNKILLNFVYFLLFYLTELKEERLLVLESWLEFEKGTNDLDRIKALQEMMPKKLKKQRLIDPNDVNYYYFIYYFIYYYYVAFGWIGRIL
jgi:hypothetical protein